VEPVPLIRRGRAVSGEVGAYLERLIRSDLSPGDRLPAERELADSLNVSRTSVREALQELEQRRLIARAPGRGTTVLPPSDSVIELASLQVADPEERDVTELRMVIEPQIADLAARRATDADLVRLEQILVASHAGLTPVESLELDVQFHRQLAASSRNPLLISLCDLTGSWIQVVRARSHQTRKGRRASVEGHRRIYDAVLAGDSVAANTAMTDHLADVARLVEQVRR